MVPVDFFVFMLAMGVARFGGARESRALLRYRRRAEVSSVCGLYSDLG